MVTTSAWLIVAGSLLCAGQTCALAQEWETPSVRSPSSHHHQHFIRPLLPYEEPQPLRIAVVGAGAAGTSSAYFLRFLSDQHLLPSVDISIFEKEDYIGGRSTTVQLPSESSHDSSGHIAEVGASIFVQANRHLQHAVKTFNLSLQSGHGGGRIEDALMAVWDGEQYVYQDSHGWGWWNTAKMLWHYGLSPIKARNAMKNMVKRFLAIYDRDFHWPQRSIASFARHAGFKDEYQLYGQDYLLEHGISAEFISDLVAAGTTVNYAQTPLEMHALETLVSIAAEGASSVKGGNRLIFEHFANHSGAAVHLSSPVTSLKKLQAPRTSRTPEWQLSHTVDGLDSTGTFDVVLIAAPWHQTGIQVTGSDASQTVGPPVEYIDLHVTIAITNASAPQACYFNPAWACKDPAPNTILTTLSPYQQGKIDSMPRINSLNYLREVSEGQWAVKLFSRHEMRHEELEDIFGAYNVLWTHRKQWFSYPLVMPLSPDEFAPLQLDDGLYYTSPMESLISTMETSSISGWNAAAMVVSDFTNHSVNSSWPDWHG